jgi:hypothetical protein
MSVRRSSSSAAVSPAGPAPMMIAFLAIPYLPLRSLFAQPSG